MPTRKPAKRKPAGFKTPKDIRRIPKGILGTGLSEGAAEAIRRRKRLARDI